jgi:hypothetical protein
MSNAMNILTKQWYNTLVKKLALDIKKFQLFQGSNMLGDDSTWLWNLYDAIPPETINHYYVPGSINSLSQDYGGIISQLKVGGNYQFQGCMGDYYMSWLNYLKNNPTLDVSYQQKWDQVFQAWVSKNNYTQLSRCGQFMDATFQDPVSVSNMMYTQAKLANKGFAYTKTIDELKSQVVNAKGVNFDFDSATASSDISSSWVTGNITEVAPISFFASELIGAAVNKLASMARIKIKANFQHLTIFAADPLTKTMSNDPVLSKYLPWFWQPALKKAYQVQDNTVWKPPGPPSWATSFSSSGSMQRYCSALVVADGIDISLSAEVNLDSSLQSLITGAISSGVWPFYVPDGHRNFQNKINDLSSSGIEVQQSSPAGNPGILGVLVSPISDLATG